MSLIEKMSVGQYQTLAQALKAHCPSKRCAYCKFYIGGKCTESQIRATKDKIKEAVERSECSKKQT